MAGCRTNNNPAWSTSGLADALQRRVRGLADDGVPPLAVAWEAVTKAAGDAWDAIGRATMGAQPSEPGPEPEPEKPEPDEPEARQVPKLAYTIDEFCKAHGIGRSTFYRLMDRGEGPNMMKVGDTHHISAEAAKRWRREREAASRGRKSGSGGTV